VTKKIVHPDSIPLVNNRGFSNWFTDRDDTNTARSFTRMHFLCKDNREDFTKVFGKRHRTFRGEFFHSVWDVTFEGKHFVIFTAAGEGTGYEYAEPGTDYDSIRDEKLTPLFIRFAKHIYKSAFKKRDIEKFRKEMVASLKKYKKEKS